MGDASMPAEIEADRIALVRYVYIDIVHFSVGRTIEAQTWMMHALNRAVRLAIASMEVDADQVLFLPTGDGVCVCLIDLADPFDLDIRIALSVLEQLYGLSLVQTSAERRFAVRIGLNENQDNLVTDIGGGLNVVGLGINSAQRIMSLAGPFQLFLGVAVHARLSQRVLYREHLHAVDAIVKHGERMLSYAYHDPSLTCFAAAPSPRRLKDDGVDGAKAVSPLVQLPLASGQRRRDRPAPSFRIR
jgi:class 3 adenylate cyclase